MNNIVADLISGFTDEIKQLFLTESATVILDTQFDIDSAPTYSMPCIIIKLSGAPVYNQMIGGAKKIQANWDVQVYNYEPNAELSDDSGYSTSLYGNIDTLTNHFALKNWLSIIFQNLVTKYGFKVVMNGMPESVKLQHSNGVIPGFTIHFESTAFDMGTASGISEPHDPDEEIASGVELIQLSLSLINIIKAGGTAPFDIISDTNWHIISDSLWLTTNVSSGSGNSTITVTAISNPSTQRTGNIIVSANDNLDQTIQVIQAG